MLMSSSIFKPYAAVAVPTNRKKGNGNSIFFKLPKFLRYYFDAAVGVPTNSNKGNGNSIFSKLPKFLRYYFATCFIVGITTTTGFAQTTTSTTTSLPPAAQDAINKGIMATKVPDYLLAVRYFEEARKAAPQSPEVFFNLGLAESKIPGRELRAICWFGAYLTASPGTANAVAVKEQMDMMMIKNQSNLNGLIKSLQEAAAAKQNDPSAMEIVALLWAGTGDINTAIKTAQLINNDNNAYKASALKDISKMQTESGDFDGASKTTELIEEEAKYKSEALTFLAESQFKAGDLTGAKTSIGICIKEAGLVKDFGQKSTALNDIAKAQLNIHDTAGARNTLLLAQRAAEQMDFSGKYDYQMWAAEIQILAGDLEIATKALLSAQKNIEIENINERNDFLGPEYALKHNIGGRNSLIDLLIKLGLISNAQNILAGALKNLNLLSKPADKADWQRDLDYRYESIAKALLNKGDLSGVREMADGIKSSGAQFQKNKILATIFLIDAKQKAESGNIKAAIKAFESAQQSIDLAISLPSYDYQKDELKKMISESQLNIVNKLINTNDLSGAQKIADIINDAFSNYSTFNRIADTLARSGDIKGAKNAVELIKDTTYKSYAEAQIAYTQLKGNDIPGAKKTLQNALSYAQLINDVPKKVGVLLAITAIQTELNDLEAVKNNLLLVKSIVDQSRDLDKLNKILYEKNYLLDIILKLQIKTGDFTNALITANLNKNEYYKNSALDKIAVAYAITDNLEDAQKAIDLISAAWHKSYTESDIAILQVKNNDIPSANRSLKMAQRYADQIVEASTRSSTYRYLAKAQMQAGDHAGVIASISLAKTAADSIQDPNYKLYYQVSAYSDIAEIQINTGDITGGKETLVTAQNITEQEVDTGRYNHEWEDINKVQQKAGMTLSVKPKPLIALTKLEKDKQLALEKQVSDKQFEKVNLWIKRLDDNSTYYDAALNTGPFLDITTELKSIPASDPNKYFDGLKNTADKIVKAQNLIVKMMKEIK